jgi:hypothetical protein
MKQNWLEITGTRVSNQSGDNRTQLKGIYGGLCLRPLSLVYRRPDSATKKS